MAILKELGVHLSSDSITNAIFEYVPCKKEGTNFDFFIILTKGLNSLTLFNFLNTVCLKLLYSCLTQGLPNNTNLFTLYFEA